MRRDRLRSAQVGATLHRADAARGVRQAGRGPVLMLRGGAGSVLSGSRSPCSPRCTPAPLAHGTRRIGAIQREPFFTCGWLSMGRSAYFQAGDRTLRGRGLEEAHCARGGRQPHLLGWPRPSAASRGHLPSSASRGRGRHWVRALPQSRHFGAPAARRACSSSRSAAGSRPGSVVCAYSAQAGRSTASPRAPQ